MAMDMLKWRSGLKLILLTILVGGLNSPIAQSPTHTKLKKVLVLDKNQYGFNGHRESRRDFNQALQELAAEKEFQVTLIGQNDPTGEAFSTANLAKYQAVIFCYNEGVHAQLDAAQKVNFETYVKSGGGFIPIHSASDFIVNWPWMTSVLVESFYGPHGNNQPRANLAHDNEGTRTDTETLGIFKGLTVPIAFLDEFYSFRASPRGRLGVTILLTVDEKSYSAPINGPMGDDHPIAWAKTEGLGRVAHISLGHSWSTNNAYAAKNGYLKYFLYGAMRYVAGDFIGCTDSRYGGYNPDATKSDPNLCIGPEPIILHEVGGKPARALISRRGNNSPFVDVTIRTEGWYEVTLLDMSGRVVYRNSGTGPAQVSVPMPTRSGLYTVLAKSAAEELRYRVTVL
jgi:type 1 glutamine amidotransferase